MRFLLLPRPPPLLPGLRGRGCPPAVAPGRRKKGRPARTDNWILASGCFFCGAPEERLKGEARAVCHNLPRKKKKPGTEERDGVARERTGSRLGRARPSWVTRLKDACRRRLSCNRYTVMGELRSPSASSGLQVSHFEPLHRLLGFELNVSHCAKALL